MNNIKINDTDKVTIELSSNNKKIILKKIDELKKIAEKDRPLVIERIWENFRNRYIS
jgi:hypothetical protein